MIEVAEALELILQQSQVKPAQRAPVAESVGCVLAEEVASDVDSPPHDKSMVDGYAVISDDLSDTPSVLEVLEEVTAGDTPSRNLVHGAATRIMTGAPIPQGADAVVMIERTKLLEGEPERVQIEEPNLRVQQNIMRRGTSLKCGEVVLKRGQVIRPIEVGLLAEVGRVEVLVHPRPSVAVLATGNELVSAGEIPAFGQIRNSNGPMLMAQASAAGGIAVDLGVARDDKESLRQLIEQGLRHDVLALAGGVSAGVMDLVPSVLAEMGVEKVFHKVRLKPGKPLWFGVRRHDDRDTLVFGLPGNPVSSLVCFELFARPAIACLSGRAAGGLLSQTAYLAQRRRQSGDRPTFLPAIFRPESGRGVVDLLDWKGSADLCSLTEANCLANFPAGERTFERGDTIEILML